MQGTSDISRFGPLDVNGDRVVTYLRNPDHALVHSLRDDSVPVVLEGHTSLVLDAAFSPDGRRVITASSDWTARLWDVQTGEEINQLEGIGTEVMGARFDPQGATMVTWSAEHMVRMWDESGHIIWKLQAGGDPQHVEFSDDGHSLLIVENGFRGHHLVRVVNSRDGVDPIELTGHKKRLYHATFSHDGRRVATASEDGTTRIYSIDWPTLRKTLISRAPAIYSFSNR